MGALRTAAVAVSVALFVAASAVAFLDPFAFRALVTPPRRKTPSGPKLCPHDFHALPTLEQLPLGTRRCDGWIPCGEPGNVKGLPQPEDRYASWREAGKADRGGWRRGVARRDRDSQATATKTLHARLGRMANVTLVDALEQFPDKIVPLSLMDENLVADGWQTSIVTYAVRDALVLPNGVTLLATDDGSYLKQLAAKLEKDNRDALDVHLVGGDAPFVLLADTIPELMAARGYDCTFSQRINARLAVPPVGTCLTPILGVFWPDFFQHFLQDHTGRLAVALDAIWSETRPGGLLDGICTLDDTRFLFKKGSSTNIAAAAVGGRWNEKWNETRVSARRMVVEQERIAHVIPADRRAIVTVESPYDASRSTVLVRAVQPLLRDAFGVPNHADAGASQGGERRSLLFHIRTKHRERNLGNHAEIEGVLRDYARRWSLDLVVVHDKDLSLTPQAAALFARARVIAMLHGGAMFNNVFASDDATVLEFVPGGTDAKGFTTALGLDYRPVHLPDADRGDKVINVDLDTLRSVLDGVHPA